MSFRQSDGGETHPARKMVGATGFEPATTCTPPKRLANTADNEHR